MARAVKVFATGMQRIGCAHRGSGRVKKQLCLMIPVLLVGCSGSESSICVGPEVEQQLFQTAKDRMMLHDEIRSATEELPFASQKPYSDLMRDYQQIQNKMEVNLKELEKLAAQCVDQPDESSINAGSMAGLAISSAYAKKVGQLTATPENKQNYLTSVCNGDFSPYETADEASGQRVFSTLMPQRYIFWRENVLPVIVERNDLIEKMQNQEILIQEYEDKEYEKAFSKSIAYALVGAALDSANDQETSFQCSASLEGSIAGWSSAKMSIKYAVKKTADDGVRVDLEDQADGAQGE